MIPRVHLTSLKYTCPDTIPEDLQAITSSNDVFPDPEMQREIINTETS
jgi:hypothetical protein